MLIDRKKDSKSKGILYLAFGEEFDKLTAETACYSRRFTDLPMCVLTNLKERSPKWEELSNVHFRYIELPANKNRGIKVSLTHYTPYDETLFIDSDAVIQKRGIEIYFSYLKDFDVVCQYHASFNEGVAFVRSKYGRLIALLDEKYPVIVYFNGAFFFRKSSEEFFSLWKRYWKLSGEGRDMPGFIFAVKHLMNKVKIFRKEKFFTNFLEDESYCIQHKGFKNFEEKFGISKYIDWEPKQRIEMRKR